MAVACPLCRQTAYYNVSPSFTMQPPGWTTSHDLRGPLLVSVNRDQPRTVADRSICASSQAFALFSFCNSFFFFFFLFFFSSLFSVFLLQFFYFSFTMVYLMLLLVVVVLSFFPHSITCWEKKRKNLLLGGEGFYNLACIWGFWSLQCVLCGEWRKCLRGRRYIGD